MDADRLQVTARASGGSVSTYKSFETIATSDANTLRCVWMLRESSDPTVVRHGGTAAIEDEPRGVQACMRIIKVVTGGVSE